MRRSLLAAVLVLVPVVALGGLVVVRVAEMFATDGPDERARSADEGPAALRGLARGRVSVDTDGADAAREADPARSRALVHDPSALPTSRGTLVSVDEARGTVRLDLPPDRLLARSEARAAWRDRLSEAERELVRERMREKRNELTPEERVLRRARREARQEALGVARAAADTE